MAATLQNLLPPDAPHRLAQMLRAVDRRIDPAVLLDAAGIDFPTLGLMERGRRLAGALHRVLPPDFPRAAQILVNSMGPPMGIDDRGEPRATDGVPCGFFYLPHSLYIERHGHAHPREVLRAAHALTQRFTAEFCLRPYLAADPAGTLSALRSWTQDASAHIRRAASESTRPRLPWAPRLPAFARDPRPSLSLLAQLRDDPSSYVRRSVANHLNDIGKDHPELLLAVAQEWWVGASPVRRRMLEHALRSRLKAGDPHALALLGRAPGSPLTVTHARFLPQCPVIGGQVRIEADVHNPAATRQSARADLRVFYPGSNGRPRSRVFRLPDVDLPAGERVTLAKTLALRQMSTRTHYPGPHAVELVINGERKELGHFTLTA